MNYNKLMLISASLYVDVLIARRDVIEHNLLKISIFACSNLWINCMVQNIYTIHFTDIDITG